MAAAKLVTSARSYSDNKKGSGDSGAGAGARRGSAAAVRALDESALNALISLALLPALWDRLLRPGLSHLRTYVARPRAGGGELRREEGQGGGESVRRRVGQRNTRATTETGCWAARKPWLSRTFRPAPPPSTVVHHAAGALRSSTSTSYDVGSDVVFSSGSLSPAKAMNDGTARRSDEIEEEEDPVHLDSASPECDDGDARSFTPTLPLEENMVVPNKLVKDTSASQVEPTKVPAACINKLPFDLRHASLLLNLLRLSSVKGLSRE
ncbi:hypothetical protein EJB05_53079, partial [Eragrostis curvula]